MEEIILAYGHENITARHRTTMQVTKDREITKRADCIIGVRASKSAADLSQELKRHLLEGGHVDIEVETFAGSFRFGAEGSPKLILNNAVDAVIRRSSYVDDRTIVIRAEASARDIPRRIVKSLRRRETILRLYIRF